VIFVGIWACEVGCPSYVPSLTLPIRLAQALAALIDTQ
jgi:hypothetical protein